MEETVSRIVVVSAVNIRKGGTLTILREYLAKLSSRRDVRVYALVHDKYLCEYSKIEYIEFPNTVKSWVRRLWCEYVTMYEVSLRIAEKEGRKVDVWVSLHDTTPRVQARHQVVYCHNSFPFLKWNLRDLWMDPKVPLFSILTYLIYRINVNKNDTVIVQQRWFRDSLARMLHLQQEKFIVLPPELSVSDVAPEEVSFDVPTFLYAATPDCHKNFETLCRAAVMLEKEIGRGRFKVVLTISGSENRYARWLYRKWGKVDSIVFAGYMSKKRLFGYYKAASCLVFPSRMETWGLPISEYMELNGGRMLLADLPYAREASRGTGRYFPATDEVELKRLMYESIAIG